MADPTIVVKGRYDGSSLNSGLAGTQSRLVAAGKTGRTFGQTMARAGKVAAVGLAGGLIAAAGAALKFGQAAADDEAAASLLEGALKRNAKATDAQVKANERWITSQGKLLGVTDDELRPALATLVTSTKDVGQAQKLASLAMDISAAKGKSLESVATALMKANNGQVSSLSRLGINTKNAAGETISMAEATKRMSDQFGGAAAGKAETLSGKMARLKVQLSEAGESIGAALLPALSQLAPYIVKAVEASIRWSQANIAPMLKDVGEWVVKNRDEIAKYAGMVKDTVLPPLKVLGEVLVGVARFFGSLPGPIQQSVIAMAGIALVAPRILGALGSVQTSLTGLTTKLKDAETRSTMLAGAAKQAGGAVGLGLLAHGATQAEGALGVLETTAGGALLGFSLGGPIGGAIGAGAGALIGLATAGRRAKDEFKTSIPTVEEYGSSLDAMTGKVTQHTRALILESLAGSDALKNITAYGISSREAVNAILGRAGASEKVRAALQAETAQAEQFLQAAKDLRSEDTTGWTQDQIQANLDMAASYEKDAEAIKNANNEVLSAIGLNKESIAAKRREIAATTDYTALVKKIPPKAYTDVQANGIIPTTTAIARLAKQYDLTPKEIKSVIAVTGVETTVGKVQRVRAELKKAGEQRPDGSAFIAGLNQIIATARANASRGGNSVGNALGAGVKSGLSGWINDVANAASAMVSAAVAAANKSGKIHSPSKETEKTGHWLGAGLAKGLAESTPLTRAAATQLVQSVLGAVTQGAAGIDKVLERVTQAVEKAINLKDDKAEAKRERAIIRSITLGQERLQTLRDIGKAQDRLVEKIRAERDELKAMVETRRQAAEATAENIKSYSALTSLMSTEEGALNDAPSLLERMRQRLGDTQEFSRLISSLRASGLAETLVQQIEGAGVEGGLALASAISAGGPAAIAEFTELQRQIDAAAGTIGTNSASAMYDAGIAMQAGLLAGLESQQVKLEAWARKIARSMIRALKDELGIKSPSTKGEEIGVNMLRGIELGLNTTHAKSIGTVTASALVDGFGTPTLKARATLSDSAGGRMGGGNTYKITANVPLGTSAAAVGEEIISKIKSFEKAGGRELATG